ncbi:hypothetical protein ABEI85_15490 [Peribacillus castrilensis]
MEKQVHILIVEDDNDISGLLCNMMKKVDMSLSRHFQGRKQYCTWRKRNGIWCCWI